MRYYINCLVILGFSIFFSACAGVISTLDGEDSTLPIVKNVKTLSDVGAIAFEWDKIDDERVSGIAIYKENKDGEFEEITYLKNPKATHFVDENLIPETQYRYKFKTTSKTHYSQDSDIITAKTSFIDEVESIFASNDYPKQVKLLFSPHPNPSISYYLIQREIDGEFKTIALVNHRLLAEYFDNNLENGKSYKYRIIAIDHAKNPSRPSKVVTAHTKPLPPAPQNITASQNLPQKIHLIWDKQSDIKSYNIYRSNSENGYFSRIATSKTNEYTDNINANSVSYFYKIDSIDNSDLQSVLSQAVKGKTKSPPKSPQITRGYVDNSEVKIEWSADSGVSHYVVYRIDSNGGKQSRFKVTQNNFNDKEVSNGGEFSYFVVAVDDSGLESEKSNKILLSIQ